MQLKKNLTLVFTYLGFIMRHKALFVFVSIAIMYGVLFYCYTLPDQYRSESTFFVERNVITDLVRGIAITPSLDAKIRVMKVSMLSRTMLMDIIDELDMDIGLKNQAEVEEYITNLQRETRIDLNERRGIFTISYTHENPEIARDYVNLLVTRYIEGNTASQREESLGATRFLKEQIDTFKQRMDEAEFKINAFKQEHGLILALDSNLLQQQIERDEQLIDQLNQRRNELSAKHNILQKSAQAPSAVSQAPSSPDMMLPEEKELAELEKKLDQYKVRYSEKHPSVVQLTTMIEKQRAIAEQARKEAAEQPAQAPTHVKDIPKQNLEAEMIRVELNALNNRIAQLKANIEKNVQYLHQIPTLQSELRELVRLKDNEAIIYNQLVSRYGQSEVSKQMELEDKSVNFRIVDPAVLATTPVGPDRPKILVAGIVLGVLFAAGFSILLEILKGKINSVSELESMNFPVLAVIPYVSQKKDRNRKRLKTLLMFCIFCVGLFGILFSVYLELTGNNTVGKLVHDLDLPSRIKETIDSAKTMIS